MSEHKNGVDRGYQPKIPGRNPPEPVERRPDPNTIPAPPLIGGQGMPTPLGHGPPLDDADAAIQAIVTIEQILAKLEHVPCMSGDFHEFLCCDGPGGDETATRCHRCAAVRLGRDVLTSG